MDKPKRICKWLRRTERRERAAAMDAAARLRAPDRQILRLDVRLGLGVGARKERRRLAARMSA
jgi:hypothetical protein